MRAYFRLLPTVSMAALLAGCCASNQYDDHIAAKLTEIDARLAEIVKSQEAPPSAVPNANSSRSADLEALAKIKPLPDKPTKAEVAAYARDIFTLSAKQNTFSSNDPQYAMIRQIGPGYIDVLAPYLDHHYFRKNLPYLVTSEDRAEVLRLLPDQPGLIVVLPFVGVEPEADVRQAILNTARKHTGWWLHSAIYSYLPMLAEDPAVWGELVELSYTKPFLRPVFHKSLEGLDPAARQEKARKLWNGQKDLPDANSWQQFDLMLSVARNGVAETLEPLLALPEINNANINKHRRDALNRLLPDTAKLPQLEVLDWYRSHRDQLRFDPAGNCYRIPSTENQ